MLAIADWDLELRNVLSLAVRPDADSTERFEAIWARLIRTFETHRALWVANFELFAQMDRLPEIRCVLGDSLLQARIALAALFLDKAESAIDKHTARTSGAFYHALLSGLISQFLIDPEHALSARDLTEALRMTAALMVPGPKPSKTKPSSHIQRKKTRRI